jgi:hypothetical protein
MGAKRSGPHDEEARECCDSLPRSVPAVNAITLASAAVLAGVLIGLGATTPYAADRFFVAREGEGVGVSFHPA